jgi:uncharacterized protein involved in tolerance to divalent cations
MYTVVFITAPDRENGKKIARHLLEKRLASCVNMTPTSSTYWWEGKIEEAEEVLLIVKTTSDKVNELRHSGPHLAGGQAGVRHSPSGAVWVRPLQVLHRPRRV